MGVKGSADTCGEPTQPDIPEACTAMYCGRNNSKAHAQLMQFWLRECQQKHPNCSNDQQDFMPTRLVHIVRKTEHSLMVNLSQHHPPGTPYCALSYCWGPRKDLFYLKEDIVEDCEQAFPWDQIPKTLQHAMIIADVIGFSYMWVDSLCIMKDSRTDWLRESAMMSSIYHNATCTIAAERSTSADEGLFDRRFPLHYLPCRILANATHSLFVDSPSLTHLKVTKNTTLKSRAWCFQERLLSRRIIIVGTLGLHWVCKQGEADEWSPAGTASVRILDEEAAKAQPGGVKKQTHRKERIFGTSMTTLDWKGEPSVADATSARREFEMILEMQPRGSMKDCLSLHQLWFALVSGYCDGKLTEGTDKLIAIAGVATRVRSHLRMRYLAGLWQDSLWLDLLWFSKYDPKLPRPSKYRAPTWSWASIDDAHISSWAYTGYTLEGLSLMCSFDTSHIVPAFSEDQFALGALKEASMSLKGLLRHVPSAWLQQNKSDLFRKHTRDVKSGDQLYGRFLPDIVCESFGDLHLMPIVRWTHDKLAARRPSWATITNGTLNALGRFTNLISGLAMTKVEDSSAQVYERVGIFYCGFNQPDEAAATFFDDLSQEDITIR